MATQNILFFGDSLTAGYGLQNPALESFPALIGQKIAAGQLDCHVINAGLSGDTTAGGLSRIDYWLSRPVAVFILELGINDILRGIPPQNTRNNLQAIVNKVKAKYPGARMVLMGMQIPAFLHSPFTDQFNNIYPALAAANNIALAPYFLEGVAGKARLNQHDRIHPNAEGYKVIAENVWPVIEKVIRLL
ncbi:MAG TPA: arylesterase [Mucilaginibacter sp.]|jgi:acyl-CoA thioesterase-1|nr:arylesterase [Mucilaginibacter sp.]